MFKSLKFLWGYAWEAQKSYLFCLILYQFTNAIPSLLIMAFPKILLDELTGLNRLNVLAIEVLAISFFIFFAKFISDYLKNTAFSKRGIILESFQTKLDDRLSKVDYESLEDPDFLNLKQNAEKFLYTNGQGFSFVLDRAIGIIGKIIIFATIIWIIGSLSIYVLLLFLFLSFLNSVAQMKFKKNYARLDMEKNPKERELAYFNSLFSDVRYGKEIRINGGRNLLINNLRTILHNLRLFYKRQMSIMTQSKFFLHLMDFLQRVVSYVYMVYMVSIGQISIANFTLYINAILTFTSSMNDVIDSINDIRQFGYYFEAVEEFMNLPMNIYEGKENLKIEEEFKILEFKNVGFKYNGTDKWALKNINCTLHAHEKIAVVGENGAGKTTFIKLLCRLYEPSEGCILLNGVDIRKYDNRDYIRLISSVFQDFQLFSIGLGENISLREEVDESKAYLILDELNVTPFVKKYKAGLKTRVHKDFDENGFEPSGGVAQKIAISRAVYKDTPIIILDEPTAALDPRSEYEIYTQFNDLVKDKAVIFISHRMSSTRFCDKIFVFENGEIIENGTHNELMKARSVYYELYSMQSKYYVESAN